MKKQLLQKVISARPVIFASLGLVILAISLGLTRENANLNRQAAAEYIPPLEVKIANLYETGFSVSWVTKEATKGSVVYSKNQDDVLKSDFTSPKAVDQRGDNTYFTHLVNITNLAIGERYYFKIVNNDQAYFLAMDNYWRQAGIPESVLLPVNPGWTPGAYSLEADAFASCSGLPDNSLTSCYRPNLVWGVLNNQDNQTANDALIFVDIPGKSSLLATLVDSNGRWAINLANLWNEQLTDYLGYQPNIDLLRITGLAKDAKASVYRPILSVINQLNQTIYPTTLTLQYAPLVNPEITTTPTPSTITTPTPTVTLTPTRTAGRNQTTPINQGQLTILFPPKNTTTLSGKIELKNKAGRWTTAKITLKKITDNRYQGPFTFAQTGEYEVSFQPDGYIKTSLGKYTLTTGLNRLESTNSSWTAGDVNGDNRINILDLGIVLVNYAKTKSILTSTDFNGDGMINIVDLSLLLKNYNGV